MTTAVLAPPARARILGVEEMRQIVRDGLAAVKPGARVLAVIPDKTRDDNTDLLFPIVSQELAARRAGRLDALVAQGTHPPMTAEEKRLKIGAGTADLPLFGEVFDHTWDDPSQLTTLGVLTADEVSSLTGGLLRQDVPIQLNARLAPGAYDVILVLGAVVPHEVAGFAGGAKYFFPGVAGPALTHFTHWLGALATIENVIGRVETPTRHVIEAAADRVTTPVVALTSVSTRAGATLRTHGLFAGSLRETMRRAAALSAHVHVRYTGRRYRRVIALLDEHYDEMWVAGKASYKLGGVIDYGGELVILAPHLKAISTTHGRLIEKYGYAPLEQVREMVDGSDELRANLCVAAHLAHVSYGSRVGDGGAILPRYRITLASAIPADVCARVKLGYAPIESIDVEAARRDPDSLVVENAGRDLYLVQ